MRNAIARPPYARFARAVAPPSTANDDAATWPLIRANTANGTQAITIAATATTVRRTNTRGNRGLVTLREEVPDLVRHKEGRTTPRRGGHERPVELGEDRARVTDHGLQPCTL